MTKVGENVRYMIGMGFVAKNKEGGRVSLEVGWGK